MSAEDTEKFVWVRRQMKDWRSAKCRLDSLSKIGWERASGPKGGGSQPPILCGHVSCEDILEGELSHSGSYGPCPHSIKVHIDKKENDPHVYADLAKQAGPRPGG